MQDENKKQDKNFELRSETVRNIVGKVPPALVRYGILAIGLVLLILFTIAYFLPYRQVYSGTAVIHAVPRSTTDSVEMIIGLDFGDRRPAPDMIDKAILHIHSPQGTLSGVLLSLSAMRDTIGVQEASCRLPLTQLQQIEHTKTDFTLTWSNGNLLNAFLGRLM